MEQLQSILTDLDNKAITKHQAYDLILVLFDVGSRRELLLAYHEFYLKWRNTVSNSSPEYVVYAFLSKHFF